MNYKKLTKILLLIMLITIMSSFASADLKTDNVMYYALDGDGIDETGNYNLTVFASSNTTTYKLVSSYSFNGVNQYLGHEGDSVKTVVEGEYSACSWALFNGFTGTATDNLISFVQGNIYLGQTANSKELRYAHYDGTYRYLDYTFASMNLNQYYHICFTFDSNFDQRLYINGSLVGTLTTATGYEPQIHADTFYLGAYNNLGGTSWFGNLDEVAVWKRNITEAEILEVYNGGIGYNFYSAVPTPISLNISNPNPINDSQFDNLNINFNLTANATYDFNCSIYINGTLNTTNEYSSGINVPVDYNVTFGDSGWYNYFINCYDNTTNVNTTTNYFLLDSIPPIINTDFINNSGYYKNNLTGTFNFFDSIGLHRFNISIDGIDIDNSLHLHVQNYTYNLSHNVSNLTLGKHTLGVEITDGHTAEKLKDADAYNPNNGLFNNYMKYDFDFPYEKNYILIKGIDESLFDTFTTNYNGFDRYKIKYKPNIKSNSYSFKVESNEEMFIVNDEKNTYGGDWIIMGDHWLDFYIPNQPNLKVNIEQINKNYVNVVVSGIDSSIEEIEFNSIGDLNIVQENYTFSVVNITETFQQSIVNGSSTDYLINIIGNFTSSNSARLNLDGTEYIPLLIFSNDTLKTYQFTKTFSEYLNNFKEIYHYWDVNLSSLTNENTTNQTQYLFDVELGLCVDNKTYHVLNLTYYDEIDSSRIKITNNYNLNANDGIRNFNFTGIFNNSNNDSFCTNIPPQNITYNWDIFRSFTLSKTGYVTRTFDIDPTLPNSISNNPTTLLDLYMIKINDSSTIVFNWLTTGYQPIDGTMRVYRCNASGDNILVESIPVISGLATANLQLFSQMYSYDIIVDGKVYTDNLGFSRCHIESLSELTYYVNVGLVDVSSFLGLTQTDCTFEKLTNTTVLMSWDMNPENSDYVSGCVVVSRNTINGTNIMLTNCSIEADGYSRIISITPSTNTFIISGFLNQSNNIAYCTEELVFSPSQDPGGSFGMDGILAFALLFIAFVLFYQGDGEKMAIGGIVALIIGFIISVLTFEFKIIMTFILILLLAIGIARYAKRT